MPNVLIQARCDQLMTRQFGRCNFVGEIAACRNHGASAKNLTDDT